MCIFRIISVRVRREDVGSALVFKNKFGPVCFIA